MLEANNSVAINKLDLLTWSMIVSDVGEMSEPARTTLFEDGRAEFTEDLARDPIPTEYPKGPNF